MTTCIVVDNECECPDGWGWHFHQGVSMCRSEADECDGTQINSLLIVGIAVGALVLSVIFAVTGILAIMVHVIMNAIYCIRILLLLLVVLPLKLLYERCFKPFLPTSRLRRQPSGKLSVEETQYDVEGKLDWHLGLLLISALAWASCAIAILTDATQEEVYSKVSSEYVGDPIYQTRLFCQGADLWWSCFCLCYLPYLLATLILPYLAGRDTGDTQSRAIAEAFGFVNTSTLHYLRNMQDAEECFAYQLRIQRSAPKLTLRYEVYHTELETSGTAQRKRVVDASGEKEIPFRSWCDCSGSLPDVRSRPQRLLRIKQTLRVDPFDAEAKEHIERTALGFRRVADEAASQANSLDPSVTFLLDGTIDEFKTCAPGSGCPPTMRVASHSHLMDAPVERPPPVPCGPPAGTPSQSTSQSLACRSCCTRCRTPCAACCS